MLDMFINIHQTYSWLGLREVEDVINHWHLLAYPLIDIEFHTDKLSSQRCIRAVANVGIVLFGPSKRRKDLRPVIKVNLRPFKYW